ncbi:hypothetical protein [Prauserella rugosa]|nr:hypothetical protein [Prauserella rugosa]
MRSGDDASLAIRRRLDRVAVLTVGGGVFRGRSARRYVSVAPSPPAGRTL